MDPLKFKRSDIHVKLCENRDKHEKDYKEAVEVFHDDVVNALTEMLEKAKAGEDYPLHVKLTTPVHYLNEYDRAIKMFDMSTQEEVELSEGEFSKYVMDQWQWTGNFESTTGSYNMKKMRALGK